MRCRGTGTPVVISSRSASSHRVGAERPQPRVLDAHLATYTRVSYQASHAWTLSGSHPRLNKSLQCPGIHASRHECRASSDKCLTVHAGLSLIVGYLFMHGSLIVGYLSERGSLTVGHVRAWSHDVQI